MQPVALDLQFGQLGAQIVERDEADEGAAAGNTALRFDDFVAVGFDHQVEALAAAAQLCRSPFPARAADRDFSQRPKARNSRSSCGAPVSTGSWPRNSGLRDWPSQMTMRRFLSAISA